MKDGPDGPPLERHVTVLTMAVAPLARLLAVTAQRVFHGQRERRVGDDRLRVAAGLAEVRRAEALAAWRFV